MASKAHARLPQPSHFEAWADERKCYAFLRATFYRWIQLWPEVCLDLVSAATVLAIGDLHVETFGTWRDVEGRLV